MCLTLRYPAPLHNACFQGQHGPLSCSEPQDMYAKSVSGMVTMQGGALDVLAAMADIEVSPTRPSHRLNGQRMHLARHPGLA